MTEPLQYDVLNIPTCACGCGGSVEARGQRFALDSCRAAAYRRRLAGAPEDTPRLTPRGRMPLLAAVTRYDGQPDQSKTGGSYR